MVWVFDKSPTKRAARLVQLSLANHASEEGFCFPGVARIAKEAGVTKHTAEAAIAQLERDGWLKRTRHGAPAAVIKKVVSSPLHLTNLYQLTKTPHNFD